MITEKKQANNPPKIRLLCVTLQTVLTRLRFPQRQYQCLYFPNSVSDIRLHYFHCPGLIRKEQKYTSQVRDVLDTNEGESQPRKSVTVRQIGKFWLANQAIAWNRVEGSHKHCEKLTATQEQCFCSNKMRSRNDILFSLELY